MLICDRCDKAATLTTVLDPDLYPKHYRKWVYPNLVSITHCDSCNPTNENVKEFIRRTEFVRDGRTWKIAEVTI